MPPFRCRWSGRPAAIASSETHLVNYPYFVDIRGDGMNRASGLITGIDQLSMTWASPIGVDQEKNKGRQVVRLLESSKGAWLSDSLNIQPDFDRFGQAGFAQGESAGRQLLAVLVEGAFDSSFKGKTSPLIEEARKQQAEKKIGKRRRMPAGRSRQGGGKKSEVIGRVLERSAGFGPDYPAGLQHLPGRYQPGVGLREPAAPAISTRSNWWPTASTGRWRIAIC